MCAIIPSYPINLSSTDFETVVHNFQTQNGINISLTNVVEDIVLKGNY